MIAALAHHKTHEENTLERTSGVCTYCYRNTIAIATTTKVASQAPSCIPSLKTQAPSDPRDPSPSDPRQVVIGIAQVETALTTLNVTTSPQVTVNDALVQICIEHFLQKWRDSFPGATSVTHFFLVLATSHCRYGVFL